MASSGRAGGSMLAPAGLGLTLVVGCGDPQSLPCEEPDGASPELDRVALVIRETELSAELAASEGARASAWAGRRCDLDALLWVPEQVGPAEISLCEVVVAVDLAFVREAEVVALESELPPCRAPCDACTIYGGSGPVVDAVLWFPAGTVDVVEGDMVDGLDGVALPTS